MASSITKAAILSEFDAALFDGVAKSSLGGSDLFVGIDFILNFEIAGLVPVRSPFNLDVCTCTTKLLDKFTSLSSGVVQTSDVDSADVGKRLDIADSHQDCFIGVSGQGHPTLEQHIRSGLAHPFFPSSGSFLVTNLGFSCTMSSGVNSTTTAATPPAMLSARNLTVPNLPCALRAGIGNSVFFFPRLSLRSARCGQP